jgi:hypothetical protein
MALPRSIGTNGENVLMPHVAGVAQSEIFFFFLNRRQL